MTTFDYQADYRAAQDAGHHVDCDGYRTAHRTSVERVSHGHGKFTYRAVCEDCGPLHIGTTSTAEGAERFRTGHAKEVPCDLRCKEWT